MTVVAALALATAGSIADGKMRTTKLDTGLCLTEGGGKFVNVPGFPGERIDRRLKRDVRFLVRRYKIFVTDGFSTDPVHSSKGEHPIGLALDIVPNKAAGGSWKLISELARWAEPRQNEPRAPFRWVGYNGDSNHGRGHHLHLSWSHSPTKFGKPARSVYSLRCPRPKRRPAEGSGKPGKDGGGKTDGGKDGGGKDGGGPNGGTESGDAPPRPPSSGGTSSRGSRPFRATGGIRPSLAPRVPERRGVERSQAGS